MRSLSLVDAAGRLAALQRLRAPVPGAAEQIAHRPDIARLIETRAGWLLLSVVQHGIWAARHRWRRLSGRAGMDADAAPAAPVDPGLPQLSDVGFDPAVLVRRPRILIDATPTLRHRPVGGITRVIRSLAEAGVATGLALPVHIVDGALQPYFAHKLLQGPITPGPDDVYLIGDVFWHEMADYRAAVARVRDAGASVAILVHDIGAIRFPALFPPEVPELFRSALLELLEQSAFCLAVSRHVELDVRAFLAEIDHPARHRLRFGHVRLGVDKRPTGTAGLRRSVTELFDGGRTFLAVGTIEPRKAYEVTLDAAERAWSRGAQFALVIMGRYGWCADALWQRIASHPERGRRLFWIADANDAELAYAYSHCLSLVQSSWDEGFCLPVSEAAVFGAAIIASDLPVIREIAGESVRYFPAGSAEVLAERLAEAAAKRPDPAHFPVPGWRAVMTALAGELGVPAAPGPAAQRIEGGPIHVACCCDAKMARQAAVLAAGVAAATRDAAVVFHIVGPAEAACGLEGLARRDFTVIRHEPPRDVGELHYDGHFSEAVYYRLSLPELIKSDRVIYLDCDVMVRRSLRPLWELDLRGHPIGATVDVLSLTYKNGDILPAWHKGAQMTEPEYCRSVLGIDLRETEYFNSGVMVMDLAAWRRDKIAERCRALCGRERALKLVDQDALNQLLRGDFLPLDQRWNALVYMEPAYRPVAERPQLPIMGGFEPKLLPPSGALQAALQAWRDDPWIVHFAHCSKPWLARDRATRHHGAWWELAFATPFGPGLARDFVEQLASG